MIQSSVQLVSYLSPHIKLPGYTPFVMAIDLASELLGEKLPDQIHFTQDVYIKISEKSRPFPPRCSTPPSTGQSMPAG